MAPEYGATMGFFPVDSETLAYLQFTARPQEQIALVEAYCKEQGLFRTDTTPDPAFSDTLELDLGTIEPTRGRAQASAGSRSAAARQEFVHQDYGRFAGKARAGEK